ncbi:MAG: DEAD/DEAH box helicase [Gammaproteobacteria bacterium]|nr:DEAD/DEAH box helicase [Gammaproteobacteria bacterium]
MPDPQNPVPEGSPATAPTFAQLGLHERLLKAAEALQYQQPTDIQQAAIPVALSGEDIAAMSETGTGKTAAFVLPILHKLLQADAPKSGTRALILTPTRELCRQVVKHCKQLAAFTHLQVNAITGGHDFKYQKAVFRKNPEILVATPGRLKEHLDKGIPDFSDLEVLVLDEADRMLDMGFMEDVTAIANSCSPARQTLLFSATLDSDKFANSRQFSGLLRSPQVISLSSARQSSALIRQQMVLSDDDKHKNKLLLKLLQPDLQRKVIIFTNTKTQANKLAGWLKYMDVNTGILHGDMDQDSRNEEMNRLRRGRISTLVATDLAARGLDVQGVDLVINYDLARNSEDFIHRTGRTGRAGEEGKAISFITSQDWDRMARFERELGLKFEKIKVPGLEARFKGPEKLKSSGKRASTTKRTTGKGKDKPETGAKVKKRQRDAKNVGKRRQPSAKPLTSAAAKWGDGFAPAPVKKKDRD